MAGNGPPPKPAAQRRNRNPLRAGAWVRLPLEGRKGRVPTLPKHLGFSDVTHDWWQGIWRSPMATQWVRADVPALIELAMLRDMFMRGSTTGTIAKEVRLREGKFGLTPEGRQKLRWVIADDDSRSESHVDDELTAKRTERRRRVEEIVTPRKARRGKDGKK